MKTLSRLTLIVATVIGLAACTGTAYNKDRTCSADYLLHPAISVPGIIGSCKDYKPAQ